MIRKETFTYRKPADLLLTVLFYGAADILVCTLFFREPISCEGMA